MSVLVFDIGGTKTRIGVSKNGKTLDAVKTIATSIDPVQGLAQMTEIMSTFAPKGLTAIAGGIRGILREDKIGIDHDDILHAWANISLVAHFADTFSVPTHLENDTALAGLGARLDRAADRQQSFVAAGRAVQFEPDGQAGLRQADRETEARNAGHAAWTAVADERRERGDRAPVQQDGVVFADRRGGALDRCGEL